MFDPELNQDYISHFSDDIEGRVTKKLSKEFSRTEPRILGALSKLDEFLLNPQVRTCSVAFPGTSRNNNSENRETTGDRSSDDPCPEVGYSSHYSGHLNSPEAENYPHSNSVILVPSSHFSSIWNSIKKWNQLFQLKIYSLGWLWGWDETEKQTPQSTCHYRKKIKLGFRI